MGRRIEVELTSCRDDGSWTWRAAGAKQPKGDLDGGLLYDSAKIGDVVKVEAEFHLDGIEITEVFAPKAKKQRTDLLELKSRPLREDEFVTTQRVSRGGRDRGDRGDRRDRGGRRDSGDRRDRGRQGNRGSRGSSAPARPKAKRLNPRREHRKALLDSVAPEHRPIVEQVMKDGMPGVRSAIEKQNAEAKAAGKPESDAAPILKIAEQNLQKARLAEWRDRADAALADARELDLRDLRSVVVVGSDLARDEESKGIADQLKTILDERMESDHVTWLDDLRASIGEGRSVRGLRLSSRPVKAGAPLPTDLATELANQVSTSLAPDTPSERWCIVLDALAFSPVRGAVSPVGIPESPSEELIKEVRRLSDRLPAIAALFGVDPATVSKSEKRRRSPRQGAKRGKKSGEAKAPKEQAKPAKNDSAAPAAVAQEAPSEEAPPSPNADQATDQTTSQAPDQATDQASEKVDVPQPVEETASEPVVAPTDAADDSTEGAPTASDSSEEE